MERQGLGKGLQALLSEEFPRDDRTVVEELPVDRIRPNPYQPRQEIAADGLEELAQSIREHGILQPILVRRTSIDEYELVAGERRLRAARRAGLRTVPAIVREYVPVQRLEIALIENLQRENINAMEAARAYRRLQDEFGMRQEDIARRVGKSRAAIANTMRLLDLPEPVQESITHGEITEGHARAILQVEPHAQLTAWEDIRRRKLSVREAEKLSRELKTEGKRREKGAGAAASAPQDPNDAFIENELRQLLGTKVTIRRFGENGRLELEFYSEDQLSVLLNRLTGDFWR